MHKNIISFLITKDEADLLERIIYLEPGIDEVLDNAKDENGLVRLKMEYEDLNECLEALSYEAQQNDAPKQKLMTLYEKIRGYGKLKELMGMHGKVKKTVVKKEKVFIFDVQMIHCPTKDKKVIRTVAISGKRAYINLRERLLNRLISFLIIVLRFIVILMSIRRLNKKKSMNYLWILVRGQQRRMPVV